MYQEVKFGHSIMWQQFVAWLLRRIILIKSVEPIPLISKKVVANPNTDKTTPIPHTQADMGYGDRNATTA